MVYVHVHHGPGSQPSSWRLWLRGWRSWSFWLVRWCVGRHQWLVDDLERSEHHEQMKQQQSLMTWGPTIEVFVFCGLFKRFCAGCCAAACLRSPGCEQLMELSSPSFSMSHPQPHHLPQVESWNHQNKNVLLIVLDTVLGCLFISSSLISGGMW